MEQGERRITENMNVETFAMLVRQSEKVRADFCKDVGITLDEYYVKQNGDFEIEDMVRAFQKGFGMALIPLQSQLTEKDKQIEELKAQIKELEAQIEKMKCCENCGKEFTKECAWWKRAEENRQINTCKDWEIKEK